MSKDLINSEMKETIRKSEEEIRRLKESQGNTQVLVSYILLLQPLMNIMKTNLTNLFSYFSPRFRPIIR